MIKNQVENKYRGPGPTPGLTINLDPTTGEALKGIINFAGKVQTSQNLRAVHVTAL